MEKPNSTDILNFQYCLVNYYVAKCYVVIKHTSKQLSSLPNDVKLRIHAIDQLEIDFVMEKCSNFLSSKHHK